VTRRSLFQQKNTVLDDCTVPKVHKKQFADNEEQTDEEEKKNCLLKSIWKKMNKTI
jgi:hypothetical protein